MSLEHLAMWSQIGGAVIFLICAVLIWRRYVAPAIKSYQESKNAELAEGERHREHMRADVEAANAEIARAGEDAREIHARIEIITTRERERALHEAQAEAERIVRNAEGELERARLAARDRLRIEFIEKALVAARARAPQRVDDAVNHRLVLRTVDDIARGAR
jgi:F0F1-type ATP synthase membrane subunit b/b'